MANEPTSNEKDGGERIPPKLDLSRTSGGNLGDTVQIKVPPVSGEEAPTLKIKPTTTSGRPVAPPAEEGKKKETSRIPLDAATTAPGEGKGKPSSAPKTIRIRPVTKSMPAVQAAPPPTVSAGSAPATLEDKRKTSRIALETVFATEPKEGGEASEPGRPKTIRLKRPTEAATIKMARPPAAPPAIGGPSPTVTVPSESKAALSKTARIDNLPEVQDQPDLTPTQRKTIRVKRPTTAQPVKSLSIRRTEEEEGEATLEQQAPQLIKDQPNVAFPLVAIAAALVACVTVYVLSSQAFGPNASWSQVSVWITGPDLPWPDKVPIPVK